MKNFLINIALTAMIVIASAAVLTSLIPAVSMWYIAGAAMVPSTAFFGYYAYQTR